MKIRPTIIIYTGSGKGKTTASLGLAFRSFGHDMKVVVIQFLKGMKEVGEFKAARLLPENFKIYQFGSGKFFKPGDRPRKDVRFSKKGLEFAKKLITEDRVDVLVLDEINVAISLGLLDEEDVLNFLNSIDRDIIVVLTGRNAPRRIIDIADIATEMVELKYMMDKKPRKGVEI